VATPGAPTEQKPSFWRTLLAGAMNGLAGSAGAKTFGAGAAGGAAGQFAQEQRQIENARENARTQSDIKFRDAQSANAAASATAQQIANEQAPIEFQMKRDKFALEYVKDLQNDWGLSFQPIPATSSAAMQYLTQLSNNDPNGAHVPDGIVTSPSTIFIPQADSENGPTKEYNLLQKASELYGLPDPGRSNYMSANPQLRRQMSSPVQNLMQGHKPDGQPLSKDELPGAIADLEGRLKKYATNPNADPKMQKIGQNSLDLLKAQKAAYDAEKEKDREFQLKIASARGESYGQNRLATWLDNDNVLHQDLVKNMPKGVAPVAAGVKAGQIGAQFDDIESAAAKVRDSINRMEPLTPENIAKISTAMREGHGITHDEIKSMGMNSLSPAQEDFVVWATQLNERALSLRNIAGMGQGAQDLRQAIKQTLASAGSGNKRIMLKQQDALDNQVAKLRHGQPKTPQMAKEQQQEPIYAVNPQTKQRIVSNDGGKTWQETR
jgi:hypothetical protein